MPGSPSRHNVRIRDSKFTLCSEFEDGMHISCRFVSNCTNEQRGVLLCAARVTTGQEFKHAACTAPGKPQRSGSADRA